MVKKVTYKIKKMIDDVEIRSYPSLILAVVEGYDDNYAFSLLFNYISGNNKTRKKIPMTAPVITSEKIPMTAPVITKDNYMAFVLPLDYTKDTVPIPLNNEIKIEIQNNKTFAVLKFKGRATNKIVQRKIENLLKILKNYKINTKNEPILMRYNSPFTPGFLRRNEVAFEIKSFD